LLPAGRRSKRGIPTSGSATAPDSKTNDFAQTSRWEGGAVGAANPEDVMSSPSTHVEQLERILFRRGLGALEADRSCCADCGRTPLAGEEIHLLGGRRQRIVCELCRPLRRDTPVASEIVRHCEHGHAVRLTARAA
jgi:hypothetical protein